MKEQLKQEILKEFDEKFEPIKGERLRKLDNRKFKDIKQFLISTIERCMGNHSSAKASSDMPEKKLVDCCPTCGNVCPNCNLGGGACTCCDCLEERLSEAKPTDAASLIQKMKKGYIDLTEWPEPNIADAIYFGVYNKAIDDVLKAISEERSDESVANPPEAKPTDAKKTD